MKADKVITIPTNFNNKLACPIMQHVDLAPYAGIKESLMESSVVEIRTADGSYPPSQWKLFDLLRLESDQLAGVITYPSHGMDSSDFFQWLVKAYAGKKDITKLAVFFYKKLED